MKEEVKKDIITNDTVFLYAWDLEYNNGDIEGLESDLYYSLEKCYDLNQLEL